MKGITLDEAAKIGKALLSDNPLTLEDIRRQIDVNICKLHKVSKHVFTSLEYALCLPIQFKPTEKECREFYLKWCRSKRRNKLPSIKTRRANADKPFCRELVEHSHTVCTPFKRGKWVRYNATIATVELSPIIGGSIKRIRYSC